MPPEDLPDRRRPIHLPNLEKGNRSTIQFVTVCTKDRQSILTETSAHHALRNLWQDRSVFRVGRYVLMPDHIHLFCQPTRFPAEPLSKWIRFWKSRFSATWKNRPQGPIWQRDFWDRELRSGESYTAKWKYVVENPVRAGLVDHSEDWPFQGEIHQLPWRD